VFAERLGCLCAGNFEYLINPERTSEGTGLGAVLTPDWNTTPTLELVARMCKKTLGGAPRVWGAPERTVRRIAYLNGSWSEPEIYETCVREGIDCVIVGETRYHGCVDAQPYLSVIELGHDRSELPIVDVLHDTLIKRGIEEDAIVELPISAENWWSPETEL
ncbi:MAG: Nif3-like dinuclear metal center hexameric protein, partial [Coriobacteriales bacterium]